MTTEWSVEIVDAAKSFQEVAAIAGISLAIRRGEFFALLGPSGCGKTTLLRLIAGLELPDRGSIRVGGRDVTALPPHRRPVHTVFQQYALFPHLTVADNVGFGLPYLPRERVPPAARGAKVREALALVRLAGYEERYPHQLSGGQRQRVALARALVLEPEVLLLDEPLAALDPSLRREVQIELKSLQRTLGLTFVFVTHDQEEALALSDRIAVMNRGRVEQLGSPAEVFERPATEFVARFTEADNFFDGESGRFVVRPEKLRLAAEPPGLAVTVEERIYQGVSTVWIARGAGGERYTVYEQNDRTGLEIPGFTPGSPAFLSWDPRHAVVLRG